MATLTIIDESSAPKKPNPGAVAARRRQAEYEGFLKAVKKGQVGRLMPGVGETTRGLAVRVTRAAKRSGLRVETWTADGRVYFRAL